MNTSSTPFIRNDYWPDYNELNVLNARIDNAMNDLNNVNSSLTSDIADVQNNLNAYITAQATAINTLDIDAVNVNAAIVRGDFGNFNHVIANNAYFDNLRVENPIYELDLVDPNITNLSVTSGNIYDAILNNANIQGASGSFDNLIINNLQVIGKVSDVNVKDATLNNVFITGSRLDNVNLTNVNTFENTRGNFNTANIGNAAIEYLVANHFTVNINQLPTPVNSGLVLGYDANGNIIPVFAKFTAQFPDNANYIWTDNMGQAFAGTAETSVAASDNLITSYAVYNEFQNTYSEVNNYFNDLHDNFNLLNSDVADEFNNIYNNFNVVNANIADELNNISNQFNAANGLILNVENNFNNLYNDINQNLLDIQNSFNNVNNSMNNVNNSVNGVVAPVEQVLNLLISPATYRNSFLAYQSATSIAYVTPANTSGTLISNASGFGAVYARMNGTVLEFSSNLDPTPIPGATIGGWDERLYNDNLAEIYSGCGNLRFNAIDLLFPDSATNMSNAFLSCRNLNAPIKIPGNVVNLRGCFQFCENFNQPLSIPNTASNVHNMLFACNNFNSEVILENGLTNISEIFVYCNSFNQPINIPESVVSMRNTFRSCRNLNQQITIPNSVTDLNRTFSGCGSLGQMNTVFVRDTDFNFNATFSSCVSLTTNEIVVDVGDHNLDMAAAFSGCQSLNPNNVYVRANVCIDNGIHGVFNNCQNFNPTSIIFDVNFATMRYAFDNCQNLNPEVIVLPNSTDGCSSIFRNCYSLNTSNLRLPSGGDDLFANCYNFNQLVTFADSSDQFRNAFRNCYSLNSNIQIPNVAYYLPNMFTDCNSLNQNIKIPDTAENMDNTFSNCYNLTEVTIGNIEHNGIVANNMFNNCSNLRNLYYYGVHIPEFRDNAFNGVAADLRVHLNHSIPMLVSNDIYNSFINGSWGMYVSPSLITNEL